MWIVRKLGQVTNSSMQIQGVSDDLIATVKAAAPMGELLQSYCLVQITEQLLAQCTNQVARHTPSAYPFGRLIAILMATIPDFTAVFVTAFVAKCPFIVPRIITRQTGQSDADYLQALGYERGENEESYHHRMCGFVALFAATIQTPSPRQSSGKLLAKSKIIT